LLFLYLTLQFILTVQRDVEQRISEYSIGRRLLEFLPLTLTYPRTEIVQEIAMCSLQYKNNLCASNPIPAMAKQCSAWETCMQRDPTVVGRAKVGAELIAEIVNSFVEPISWKTLVMIPILSNDVCSADFPRLTRLGIHIDIPLVSDSVHQCTALSLPLET
jgi:Di-sulfide bridge nucleocytoplasmic transport domain